MVLLDHTVSAFLPGVARAISGTPLSFLFDGGSAVFLFFLLSGVAVSYSFAGDWRDLPAAMGRRLIRLGLPMAAALTFGAMCLSIAPNRHVEAARMVGPAGTLATLPVVVPTLWVLARQIVVEGMLVGTDGNSLVPRGRLPGLPLTSTTGLLDPPLWTLHIEWIGSVLVLSLTALRIKAGRRFYRASLILLGLCMADSRIALFVVGHLAAPWLRRPVCRPWLGCTLLGIGVLVCSAGVVPPLLAMPRWFPSPITGLPLRADEVQKVVGAVLVFGGVSLTPGLCAFLSRPFARRLGELSFSIYLVHYPIMLTLGSAIFVVSAGLVPVWIAGLSACIAECASTFALGVLFQKLVDRPSISLSHRMSKRVSD